MLKAGLLRHQVTISRPSTSVGDRGERTGAATTVASSVPCSIETLAGRELEQARQLYATATVRVAMYVASSWAVAPGDYLTFGSRTLYIGHVNDVDQLGVLVELLCGEEK